MAAWDLATFFSEVAACLARSQGLFLGFSPRDTVGVPGAALPLLCPGSHWPCPFPHHFSPVMSRPPSCRPVSLSLRPSQPLAPRVARCPRPGHWSPGQGRPSSFLLRGASLLLPFSSFLVWGVRGISIVHDFFYYSLVYHCLNMYLDFLGAGKHTQCLLFRRIRKL